MCMHHFIVISLCVYVTRTMKNCLLVKTTYRIHTACQASVQYASKCGTETSSGHAHQTAAQSASCGDRRRYFSIDASRYKAEVYATVFDSDDAFTST